jgi:shikimate kinase/3-dehydroquinate synthase
MKPIFLYGPSGSGKSTVGRALAERLAVPFVDLDEEIESAAGQTIPQIMEQRGEAAFRVLESDALKEVVMREAGVIALGGGTLLRDENRSLVESTGEVVYLEAGVDTLVSRLNVDGNRRPLLAGDLAGRLEALLRDRGEHYRSFGLRLNAESQDPSQVAQQIQVMLGRYHVSGMGQAYDVLVRRGGINALGELLRERKLNDPLAVVTESNVGPLYAMRTVDALKDAGYEVTVITLPAGESFKTVETVMTMWRGFLGVGMDRRSTVVALGGGVTGDLAGFAASTFMRGCPWVVVPTSLLSMVDASLGGKTGFDLPEGKNLVGAFHSPRLVLADPDLLATLPEAELRSGLAEVVKHGVISDASLFEMCAAGYEAVRVDLDAVVRRAMAVKIQYIEADPYERGIRAALNFGHTVGHAVELASGFKLRHGEAVAIGMVAETRLAERLGKAPTGLSGRITAVLDGLGLPTTVPSELSREVIVRAMERDKKKAGGVVRFALPVEIGKVEVGVPMDDLATIFKE